jgi:hypothetical protein
MIFLVEQWSTGPKLRHFDTIVRPKRGIQPAILIRSSLVFVRNISRQVYAPVWWLDKVMRQEMSEQTFSLSTNIWRSYGPKLARL